MENCELQANKITHNGKKCLTKHEKGNKMN